VPHDPDRMNRCVLLGNKALVAGVLEVSWVAGERARTRSSHVADIVLRKRARCLRSAAPSKKTSKHVLLSPTHDDITARPHSHLSPASSQQIAV